MDAEVARYARFAPDTPGWVDVRAYRRRGLAAACVEALIVRLRATGREPVWGALADNEPSLRLARRLGFAPVADITVFRRPAGR
jgi:predicted GNAT family acetyltransferase